MPIINSNTDSILLKTLRYHIYTIDLQQSPRCYELWPFISSAAGKLLKQVGFSKNVKWLICNLNEKHWAVSDAQLCCGGWGVGSLKPLWHMTNPHSIYVQSLNVRKSSCSTPHGKTANTVRIWCSPSFRNWNKSVRELRKHRVHLS